MGNTTKIKICGIKSPQIARAAQAAGADFLGLVFAATSRRVDKETALRIREAVPDMALAGVFKNQPLAVVLQTAQECGLDIIQLHGDEPPDFLEAISLPVFRSVAVSSGGEYTLSLDGWQKAEAFVFDRALADGSSGGAGQPFAWAGLKLGGLREKAIVAGGLTPDNVGAAIRALRPYAVDVSGGVEDKGGKSAELIREFIQKAREADEDA